MCAWNAEINNSELLLSENSESTEGASNLNNHYTKSLYYIDNDKSHSRCICDIEQQLILIANVYQALIMCQILL